MEGKTASTEIKMGTTEEGLSQGSTLTRNPHTQAAEPSFMCYGNVLYKASRNTSEIDRPTFLIWPQ